MAQKKGILLRAIEKRRKNKEEETRHNTNKNLATKSTKSETKSSKPSPNPSKTTNKHGGGGGSIDSKKPTQVATYRDNPQLKTKKYDPQEEKTKHTVNHTTAVNIGNVAFEGTGKSKANNLGVEYRGKDSAYTVKKKKEVEKMSNPTKTKGDSSSQKYWSRSASNLSKDAQDAYTRGETALGNKLASQAQEYQDKYDKSKKTQEKGYDALTGNEALLLQTLGRTGNPEYTRKGLTAAQQTYANGEKDKEYGDITGKIARDFKHDVDVAPFAQGVIQGANWIPVKSVVKQTTGVDDLNLEGDKTGFYKAGELAGFTGQALATGGVTKGLSGLATTAEKAVPKMIGKVAGTRVGNGLINSAVDIVPNMVMAREMADNAKEAGYELPSAVNEDELRNKEAKGGKYMSTNTEPGATPDDAKNLVPRSIDNWNNDLVEQAYDRAEKLGQEPIFGRDKYNRLHYSFTKEGLANVIEYYNNAEDPTYSLGNKKYSDSDALRFGKNVAVNEAISFGAGALLGGGAKVKGETKVAEKGTQGATEGITKAEVDNAVEVAAKNADEVAEQTAETTGKKESSKLPNAPTKEQELVLDEYFGKGAKNTKEIKEATGAIYQETKDAMEKAANETGKVPQELKEKAIKEWSKRWGEPEAENLIKSGTEQYAEFLEKYSKAAKKAKGTELPTKEKPKVKVKSKEKPKGEADDFFLNAAKDDKKATLETKRVDKAVEKADTSKKPTTDTSSSMKQMSDQAVSLQKNYSKTRAEKVKEVEEYIKNYEKKGVDFEHHNIEGSEINGKPTQSYVTKVSNNEKWYQDFYKKNGRPPRKKEIKALAEEIVTDAERGNTGRIDIDFKDLKRAKEDVDGYRIGLEEYHQQYYPDYTDAEFQTLVRTGLEKEDWTTEMKMALNTNATNLPTNKSKIKAQMKKPVKQKVVKTSTGSEVPSEAVGATKNANPPKYKESQSRAAKELETQGEGKTMYEAETHESRNAAADVRLQTDFEGEVKDLIDTTRKMSTEDIATSQKAYDQLRASGRDVEANNLMRHVAEQSTEKGHELESLKHIKSNTPSGKVYEGYKVEAKARHALEKKNPALVKEAGTQVKKHVDMIKKAAKDAKTKEEFVENVEKAIDKILAERKIKAKVPLRDEIVEAAKKVKSLDNENMEGLIDEVTTVINRRLRIPTLSGEQVDRIVKLMKEAETAETEQLRKDCWARADEIIHSVEESTARDKFRGLQRILMLSNPKTLFSRNFGGNILLASAENIKDIPATLADIGASKALGTERTTTLTMGKKLKAQAKGMGEGFKGWGHDIKTGLDTAPTQTHYEYGAVKTFDPTKVDSKVAKGTYKFLDFLDTKVKQGLQLGDRPMYQAAFNSRVAELETLVNKGKASLTHEQIQESARVYALDRVFQAETPIAKWASATRRQMGIVGDIIMPFTQTPANILDKLIDYSPVGFARGVKELGKVNKGTFDQKLFADRIGRSMTGAGVILAGYAAAKHGVITTDLYAQSDSTEEYKMRKLLGEQSYSLKLGDDYYTINWMQPVGSLAIMGADAYYGGTDQETLLNAVLNGGLTAVDGVFSESFLSGVTNLITEQDYGNTTKSSGLAHKVSKTVFEQGTGQMNMNLLTSLTKVIDPEVRETYDPNSFKRAFNTWKSKTPGLSKTLPTKVDIAGNDVKQYQGRDALSRAWEAFLDPFNHSAHQSDAVNQEVINIYNDTGTKGVLLNSVSNGKLKYNDETYVIKNGKYLSKVQKEIGQYATSEIERLMKKTDKKGNSTWDSLSSTEKAEKISAINKKALEVATEHYLVESGEMTQEQYDYTTLSKEQQAIVDKGTISATKVRKSNIRLEKKGANTDTTKMSELYKMGLTTKEMKALGYNPSLTTASGRGISSGARAKALADANVKTKVYNQVTSVDYADADGNGSLTKQEVKDYIEEKYPNLSYKEKLAIVYARFGSSSY